MNKWQKINYQFFLTNNKLKDSPELMAAFMSGYRLSEHIIKHGIPKAFQKEHSQHKTEQVTEDLREQGGDLKNDR